MALRKKTGPRTCHFISFWYTKSNHPLNEPWFCPFILDCRICLCWKAHALMISLPILCGVFWVLLVTGSVLGSLWTHIYNVLYIHTYICMYKRKDLWRRVFFNVSYLAVHWTLGYTIVSCLISGWTWSTNLSRTYNARIGPSGQWC